MKDKERINISITPRADCPACKGLGMVRGDLAPNPFGSGFTNEPDMFCDCVIEQMPDDEREYDITLKFEKFSELVVVGNAMIEKTPNGDKLIANFDEYIFHSGEIDTYAPLFIRAPKMLSLLQKALPLIQAEADHRDEAHEDVRVLADNSYWSEMRELETDIAREIWEALGRPVVDENFMPDGDLNDDDKPCPHGHGSRSNCLPELCDETCHMEAHDYDYATDEDSRDKPSAETCPHGYGFVEYCKDCALNTLIEAAEKAAEMWDSNSASVDPEEVHAMLVDAVTSAKKAKGESK